MAIGLYRDLAVGANPAGAETWQQPHVFATAAQVGAPPDDFNRDGQAWGLPPWIPHRLREAGFAPWISLLHANMRHAGGLRIDHVMGLMRLFWIAQGQAPVNGAYVRYPLADLLALLALESTRHRCLVVGEDLGTVPDEVRAALHDAGVYSYRVLYFEKRPPREYPAQALVAISTHDLPTWRGFQESADRAARDELAQAFAREGLDPADAHRYIARTPCALLTLQLEDVFGQREQANLPGTLDDQYPNWRRKVPLDLEDWDRDGRFAAVCAAIRSEGRGPPP
jgi:(1->4)-alpha-D-glucan 1-alpha-D-glucosylmutase